MESAPIRILLIEDNPDDVYLIQEYLTDIPQTVYVIERCMSLTQSIDYLNAGARCDVILMDLGIPDNIGIGALEQLCTQFPAMPVIVLTDVDDEALGCQAVKLGAQDYLIKDAVDGKVLNRVLHYAIERKKGQEALQRSEAYSRNLMEAMPIGMLNIGSDGTILYENHAMKTILGRSNDVKESIIGRKMTEIPTMQSGEISKQLQRLLSGETIKSYVTRYTSITGRVVDAEINAAPVFDQDRNITHFIIMLHDITQKVEIESGTKSAQDEKIGIRKVRQTERYPAATGSCRASRLTG